MGLTKAQLEALNITSFPDNTTGLITPTVLRGYNTASIENTVNQDVYTTDSASFKTSITNLNAATSSYVTSAITASSLITASFDNGTRNLTFTKGNNAQFSVNIPDVSGSTGNFATTGSNSFVGNQTIAGGLIVSGSSPIGFSGSAFRVDTTGAILFKPGTDITFQGNTVFTNPIRTTFINVDNLAGGGYYGFNAEIDGRIYQDFSGSVNTRINNIVAGTGFATTGSNTFNGNQTITGSVTISGSATNDLVIEGRALISAPTSGQTPQLQVSSSLGRAILSRTGIAAIDSTGTNLELSTADLGAAYLALWNSTGTEIGFNLSPSSSGYVTGWSGGPSIYVNDGPSNFPAAIGFQSATNYTDGTVTILKPLDVSGSLDISGNITASLQQGFVLVGGSNGRTTTVATSSFGGGTIATGSFATTGSNNFRGNQTITGSILQSGSLLNELTKVQIAKSNKADFSEAATLLSLVGDGELIFDQYIDGGNYDTVNIRLIQNSGSQFRDYDGGDWNTWLKIPTNTGNNPSPIFTRGLKITGSLATTGTINGLTLTRGVNNNNTALGVNVLQSAVSGGNVAIGTNALIANTSGTDNVALGDNSLAANISGDRNMAIGSNTLDSNTTGTLNVAIGNATLAGLVGGSANIGIGFEALKSQTTGSNNVGIGSQVLNQNISGSGNIAFGAKAGYNETGNNNFYINNTEYGSINADRSGSLMWGKMDTTTANQTLQINARTKFTNEVLFTTGSNQQAGTAVLDGGSPGTVTVSNSLVTANSIIMLTKQTLTNAHMVAVTAKSASSFTITSNGNGDTDTVGWFIINNS